MESSQVRVAPFEGSSTDFSSSSIFSVHKSEGGGKKPKRQCCFFHLSDENEAEMAEKAAKDDGDSGNSDEEDEDDDEEGVITEVRFVPSDKTACE